MLETYNPLQLTQMKLFRNDVYDVMNYNKNRPLSSLAEHISVDIKITRLYKFASAHENKMRIFKQTIEEVVGFRIMY